MSLRSCGSACEMRPKAHSGFIEQGSQPARACLSALRQARTLLFVSPRVGAQSTQRQSPCRLCQPAQFRAHIWQQCVCEGTSHCRVAAMPTPRISYRGGIAQAMPLLVQQQTGASKGNELAVIIKSPPVLRRGTTRQPASHTLQSVSTSQPLRCVERRHRRSI